MQLPKKVIDLTRVVEPEKDEPQVFDKPTYLAVGKVLLFNHGGTHFDPPVHLIKGGKTVDQVGIENFVGPARVFDFRSKPRSYALTKEDFSSQKLSPGDMVVAVVGCTAPPCPHLGKDAAEYLASIPVRALATDMLPGIASLPVIQKFFAMAGKEAGPEMFPEHTALLSKGVVIIEGLTNLEQLINEKNVLLVAFPLKLKSGSGAPVRAAAFVY